MYLSRLYNQCPQVFLITACRPSWLWKPCWRQLICFDTQWEWHNVKDRFLRGIYSDILQNGTNRKTNLPMGWTLSVLWFLASALEEKIAMFQFGKTLWDNSLNFQTTILLTQNVRAILPQSRIAYGRKDGFQTLENFHTSFFLPWSFWVEKMSFFRVKPMSSNNLALN